MVEIELPDGTILEAPDGADIKSVVQGYNKARQTKGIAAAEGAVQQARAEREATPNTPRLSLPGPLGMAADAGITGGLSTLGTAAAGWRGLAQGAGNLLGMGGKEAGNLTEETQQKLSVAPVSRQGQALAGLHAKPFEWLAGRAQESGDVTAEATGSPLAGAAVNTAIQASPMLLSLGRGTPAVSRAASGARSPKAPAVAAAERTPRLGSVPPTIEELAAQSKAAYKKASDAGVTIVPRSFDNLKNKIGVTLKKEGIDPTLHPGTTAAFKRIAETKGALTLDQLETLRKIANDARGGINKSDNRLAGKIVEELDGYIENISPKDVIGKTEGFEALKEARQLYSRKAKAEEIAKLVKRAEISAPNFSASGYENALRIQFKQLAMNDKKMRRFTPEERAVIEQVSKGGFTENTLRMIGKMAPTGVVSGMFATIVTAITGGAGAILPAAGMAGRYLATRATKANALKAEETMRRGPPPKPKKKQTNALLELETLP